MNNVKLNKWFNLKEFESDEGQVMLDEKMFNSLVKFREEVGKCIITSAFRTKTDTKRLLAQGYKTSYNSQHNKGKAVDIKRVWKLNNEEIIKVALDCGFKGIGIGKSFIHLDVRENTSSKGYNLWYYNY